MLPTPMATLQLDSFLIKLYRLGRRQLDVSVLSIGTQMARRTGSLLFWVIIGFFAFFLFLALNIAAGFALASSFDESPAWGFLYLALGYVGLILLTLLLRSWLLHWVRQAVARRVLARARRINDQLDRMTPEISYQSSLDRPEGEVPYTALQRGLGRSLVERSRSTEEILRDVRYIKENYKGILAKTAQREAMNYATQLPGVSSVLHFFGYKGDLGRHRRPSHTKVSQQAQLPPHQGPRDACRGSSQVCPLCTHRLGLRTPDADEYRHRAAAARPAPPLHPSQAPLALPP